MNNNKSIGGFGCLTILLLGTAVDLSLAWLIKFICNHLLPSANMDFSTAAFISSIILFIALFVYSAMRKKVDDEDLV
jgi:ABC-type multidrug transport system fused ATPase/permease subunit